jgi:hypothetical protein
MEAVLRLGTRQLATIGDRITLELEARQQAASVAARRAAFKARFGQLCSWCLLEDGGHTVVQQGVPTGLYIGVECRSRRAVLTTPEKWRAMHDPAPVNAEVTE